jgi:hypothetical protein
VEQADELHDRVVPGLAQHVGDGLGTGQALAGSVGTPS